jgi:hypothetical protein
MEIEKVILYDTRLHINIGTSAITRLKARHMRSNRGTFQVLVKYLSKIN